MLKILCLKCFKVTNVVTVDSRKDLIEMKTTETLTFYLKVLLACRQVTSSDLSDKTVSEASSRYYVHKFWSVIF